MINTYINSTKIILVVILVLQTGCSSKLYKQQVTIQNKLDINRTSETVTIPITSINKKVRKNVNHLIIKNNKTGVSVPYQIINDSEFVFQLDIKKKTTEIFTISISKEKPMQYDTIAYARFVPERIDDFAWENDKVAFRTFGPEAKKMALSDEGGLFSSGVDCWLKRVDYPIINKWYKMSQDGEGDYHKDTGEGLDNYHVGSSLGNGGLGVWRNKTLSTSGNFDTFESVISGPLKTQFQLNYTWELEGEVVSEEKNISLNKGSNLVRYEIIFNKEVNDLVTGIPLGKHKTKPSTNEKMGWYSIWMPHADSELGQAIVIDPKYVVDHIKHITRKKDESHLFVRLKPINGRLEYYAGFAWKKSRQFNSEKDWHTYLEQFSLSLHSPLKITIN